METQVNKVSTYRIQWRSRFRNILYDQGGLILLKQFVHFALIPGWIAELNSKPPVASMRYFAEGFQKVLKPVKLIDMKGWRKLCQQASFLFTHVVNNLHKINDIFFGK